MTDIDRAEASLPVRSTRAGVYIAVLQLVFTLGWTVYVIYLPTLAKQVGLAPSTVILILLLDQAIFTIADAAMGAAADKTARIAGRLGPIVGLLAAISCAAFVALPVVAGTGPAAQVWFIALIVVWAVTSSALRAPPIMLLGKYGARPSWPLLSALVLVGYGIASGISPFLGGWLRDIDARLPFAISSAVLLLTALALSKVKPSLVGAQPSVVPRRSPPAFASAHAVFIAAMALLALGFQLHVSINSTPLFLRFVGPTDLKWLTPVFWLGFNAALFPAGMLGKRRGALTVIAWASGLGAAGLIAAHLADNLGMMIAAQIIAGAAWGFILTSAVTAAFAIGATGAEGKLVGLVFSALALATFARLGAVAASLDKMPGYADFIRWAPVACWLTAAAMVLALVVVRMRGSSRQASANAIPNSSSDG